MSYKIIFDKIAKTDIDAIKKSGDKSSLKKLNKILDELGIHQKQVQETQNSSNIICLVIGAVESIKWIV